MKFVKSLALIFLSLLLFLSLSVLGLMFTLNSTVLDPDFIVREVDKLDVPSLAEELLDEQVRQLEVPAPYKPYVAQVLDDTVADLEPWMKEQINTVVYTSYDYFMGRSQRLSLTVHLKPVKDALKQNLREAILDSPPPELQGLPPSAIEQFLDEAYQQIDQQIPAVQAIEFVDVDQGTLGFSLGQIRQAIGYSQLGYKVAIGFIVLLILGIILIYREVRGATRALGITFLTCGVITYLGNFVTKYFAEAQVSQLALPVQFQAWLTQLLADFLAPLDIYSIVLAAIGIVLLIVSFVYKPRQPSL